MNFTSQDILTAMEIIANSQISKLKFDKTIEGTIDSVVNVDTGEYKILSEGNTFSAFSNDLTIVYDVKDNVYVKIPEGDYSKKKIIEGKVETSSKKYSESTNMVDVVNLGPDFSTFYGYDLSEKQGLIAGVDSSRILFQSENIASQDSIFQSYSNNCSTIKLTADFQTSFSSDYTSGNYGIIISFKTRSFSESGEEIESISSYRLDINNFTGNPYRFTTASPQEIIFNIENSQLLGLYNIIFFAENFETDKIYNSSGELIFENTINPNIFVKNIKLQFVEIKDLSDNLYYLHINTPQGNTLIKTNDSLELIGSLNYSGKNILSEDTCVCNWYKENASIVVGHEKYDKTIGPGWEKIEGDFNTLKIEYDDVLYQNRYQLQVVYNEEVTLTDIITIYKYNSGYDLELLQKTDTTKIILEINNKLSSDIYLGNWYQYLPDNSYTLIKEKSQSIEISSLLIYSSSTFYCEILDAEENVICVLNKTVYSQHSDTDLQITYIGQDVYQYNADGDIAIEDSEKERTLEGKIDWKDGYGSTYKITWMAADGTILSNTRYSPKNSMLQDMWIDNNYILHYKVKQKYYNYYNNNSLTLIVTTGDEHKYSFVKEILFLKDGDQGTNGTTYICAIRPIDKDTQIKLSGITPLYYNNTWDNSKPLYLKCFVYKDGEMINGDPNFSIKYEWSCENLTIQTIAESVDLIYIIGNGDINQSNFIVKCTVTITNKNDGTNTNIYYNYPVDIIVNNIDISKISLNLPSYIKYTSSGVNASYFNDDLSFIYDKQDYTNKLVSLNPELLNITEVTEEDKIVYKLKPASTFYYENGIAAIKCPIDDNNYLLHPIMMYLDTYGNEAINGWDGTSIKTQDGSIFAPQIGAGEKNSAGVFTGVVMGKDSQQSLIGLYGYQLGVNTFGLKEDGTAFFGSKTGGGQIVINGNSATIQGGSGGNSKDGMTIILANVQGVDTTKAINVNQGKFYVQYNGFLHAEDVEIEGTVTATTLTATEGGTIGDFTISKEGLSGGSISCKVLTATNQGTIGCFTIDKTSLINSNGSVIIDNSGINTKRLIISDFTSEGVSKLGEIGLVMGNDGQTETYNIGMVSSDTKKSVILNSRRNIALYADNGALWITTNSLVCNTPKENQSGIYARFA